MTDTDEGASYGGGTQREVKEMSGTMQPQEYFEFEARRRQQEAREWARAEALGRMASTDRARSHVPSRRIRLLAVASPMVVTLGLLASQL